MNTAYLFHLLGWMLPVAIGQWIIAHRVFLKNFKAVIIPPLIVGTYFVGADSFAIAAGIWRFDPGQILGIHFGFVPLEEVIFFYLTSLLVSQSFVMFLPEKLR